MSGVDNSRLLPSFESQKDVRLPVLCKYPYIGNHGVGNLVACDQLDLARPLRSFGIHVGGR